MPKETTFPVPIRLLPRPEREETDQKSHDPFVRLSSDGHPLRAYLACLEIDGRVIVPHLTILMEPNEYPGSRLSGARAPIGNRQVERIWRQGFLRHRITTSKSIVGPEELALPSGELAEDVPRHSPLAWCRKTGAYATPLCPTCLGIMKTCRDEVLLRRSSLPSYEKNLVRFLYCDTCSADESRPPVFYTYSLRKLDGLAEGVQLRRRSELYRDLGPRISSSETLNDAQSAISDSSTSGSIGDLHPCFVCEHRTTCYPTGRHVGDRLPAEELLFPLAYYDFYWMPLEPLPLDFQETVAFLGGGSPDDLTTARSVSPPEMPLRHEVLTELKRPGSQFFFEGDNAGFFPLESLYLKLSALTDLARGARDLLDTTGFAHLALTPDRLRGHLSVGPSILPVRWGLTFKIGDLLTTAPPVELEAEKVPGEPKIGCLPHPCPETFLPEGMCRSQIENLWMRLAVEDLRMEKTSAEQRALIKARLTAPDLYRGAEHGIHDLVRIVLVVDPAGGERIVFSGRKTESAAGGFFFAGSTGPLSADVYRRLESTDLPVSSNVEVTIAHAFAAPADITSLGLLMLRLLLANDQQDLNSMDTSLAGVLAEAVAGDLSAPDFAEHVRLHQAFQNEGISSHSIEVLHRQIDRTAAQPAIPSSLWADVLLLALRMASNLPGWSICAAQDDYSSDNPAKPLRMVIQEMEELVERARGSLIGSGGRNSSVQEVCADFLTDLQDASQPGMEGAVDDTCDRTMVLPPEGTMP